jgi:CHAT domain-containing protein/tetratricopeptide (TPR) repeat protein
MSFIRFSIMNFRWAGLALTVLLAVSMSQMAGAQDQAATAKQILELEGTILKHEATSAGRPDAQKEMQYLLAMAQLANLYVKSGRVADSWPLNEKILSRVEKIFGPDSPNIVSQLEANAASYAMQGRFAEAEKMRKRAVVINERSFGTDSLNVALSLQGMAGLFRLQERYEEALPFATRALEIANRKLPANSPQRANFLSQVADIHMSAKNYDKAKPLLKQSLAFVEQANGLDPAVSSMQMIQYLQSLGLAHLSSGQPAEGRPYIDRALAIATRFFGPDHAMSGAMLMTLALQLADQGQLDEAEGLYKKALPISEKQGKLQAMLADNYVGLGLVEFKRRNWASAHALLRQASQISIAIEQIASAGGAASSNRVTPRADIFLLHAVAAYRTAEAGGDLAALRDEAFQMAQRAERSQVAGAMAQMAARIGAGSGPLGAIVRERQDLAVEWQRNDKVLEAALTAPQAQRDAAAEQNARQRMAAISVRLTAIDTQIAKDFPDFAKLSDPAPLSITDVQRLLQPGEVMIAVANRLNQSIVWAISRDAVKWDLVPIGEQELAKELKALRCGLDSTAWQADGDADCTSLTGKTWQPGQPLPFDLARAHALYKGLLGPFEDLTRGAHLLFTTSGLMASLPLHVLVTDAPAVAIPGNATGYKDAAWLTKRNAITNLPSVSSLKSLRVSAKASRASNAYIGIANPLLDGPDARYAERAQGAKTNRTCIATMGQSRTVVAQRSLAPRPPVQPAKLQSGLVSTDLIRAQVPLPETATEVCAVAKDLGVGDRDIRLAERATEAEVKKLSATGELAKYRVVHFATHGALAGQISSSAEAGLMLTPPVTASATDDGYLTTSEIAELKLDADWVILSACNTAGAGRAGAESLSGLARAFFYAQARALLVSHWEVNSEAAVKLVTATVGETARDPAIGRAEALRRAMKALIDKSQGIETHPSYWAPFVVVGEGGIGKR